MWSAEPRGCTGLSARHAASATKRCGGAAEPAASATKVRGGAGNVRAYMVRSDQVGRARVAPHGARRSELTQPSRLVSVELWSSRREQSLGIVS